MDGAAKILMRRMGTKTEAVRKGGLGGFLGGKETHVSLDGTLADGEKLCLVSNDGQKAVVVTVADVPVLCGERRELEAGDMLFAVFRPPFFFRMNIAAGEDPDGFPWLFEVGGMLEIRKPEAFARTFRGEVDAAQPLSSATFEKMLGTMPATAMHDKVILDVFGVMSLSDKDVEDRYVDIRKRLNEEKGVGEKYVASAVVSTFEEFFGEEEVVLLKVTSFQARSPAFEEEIARQKELIRQQRIQEINQATEEEAEKKRKEAARAKEQAEEERRRKELADAQHLTALARERAERERIEAQQAAELEAQKMKLNGGSMESAFEAFEMLANLLGGKAAGNGGETFSGLLQEAHRSETGLKMLAVARDRKTRGRGVKLQKNKRTYVSTRGLVCNALKHNESLSSTIVCERRGGHLTLLNVTEKNEVRLLLPNADFPEVRVESGSRTLVGDEDSELISEITEDGTSGTDHLVAIISDRALLAGNLPEVGEELSPAVAGGLAAKLASLDDAEWTADVMSFKIVP